MMSDTSARRFQSVSAERLAIVYGGSINNELETVGGLFLGIQKPNFVDGFVLLNDRRGQHMTGMYVLSNQLSWPVDWRGLRMLAVQSVYSEDAMHTFSFIYLPRATMSSNLFSRKN